MQAEHLKLDSKSEWRLKREKRREKQRQANIGRALKMHRERMAAKPLQVRTKPPVKSVSTPQYFIGCSGWFYWHWRGVFYPEESTTTQWFGHYASRFRTVELNAPFVFVATVATVNSWIKQMGRRKFVYTVKVCELITHVKRFRGTHELVRDFGYIAWLLGSRLGCFLFQLPPSFRYTPHTAQIDPESTGPFPTQRGRV